MGYNKAIFLKVNGVYGVALTKQLQTPLLCAQDRRQFLCQIFPIKKKMSNINSLPKVLAIMHLPVYHQKYSIHLEQE